MHRRKLKIYGSTSLSARAQNKDGFINIADTFNSSTVVLGVLNILELRKLRGEPAGGVWILDKLALLAPYVALAVAVVAIAVGAVYARKRWLRKASMDLL